MEVIFIESVKGVALKGDIKNVKRGFFRNYLLPYGKALLATESAKRMWEKIRQKMLLEKETLKAKAAEVKERLEGKTFVIKKKATKKGTLYKAISPADLIKIILEQAKVEIGKDMCKFNENIKKIGAFEVDLILTPDVQVKINVEVQPEESFKSSK